MSRPLVPFSTTTGGSLVTALATVFVPTSVAAIVPAGELPCVLAAAFAPRWDNRGDHVGDNVGNQGDDHAGNLCRDRSGRCGWDGVGHVGGSQAVAAAAGGATVGASAALVEMPVCQARQ